MGIDESFSAEIWVDGFISKQVAGNDETKGDSQKSWMHQAKTLRKEIERTCPLAGAEDGNENEGAGTEQGGQKPAAGPMKKTAAWFSPFHYVGDDGRAHRKALPLVGGKYKNNEDRRRKL